MTAVPNEASAQSVGLFSRVWKWWEKVGSVLGILGLANLFDDFVRWASGINWVLSKYAAARDWLFSWLPFYIYPDIKDALVFLLVLFSVTNIGFYHRTGYTLVGGFMRVLPYMLLIFVLLPLRPFSKWARSWMDDIDISWKEWTKRHRDRGGLIFFAVTGPVFILGALSIPYLVSQTPIVPGDPSALRLAALMIAFFGAQILWMGAIYAWRWVVGTAAAFAALVAINYLYVNYLAPFAQ